MIVDYDFLKIDDFDGNHGDGVHDDGGLRDEDSYIMIFLLIIIRVNIFLMKVMKLNGDVLDDNKDLGDEGGVPGVPHLPWKRLSLHPQLLLQLHLDRRYVVLWGRVGSCGVGG